MDRQLVAIAWGVTLGLAILTACAWAADYVFPPSLQVDLDPALGRTAPMKVMAVIVKLISAAGAAFAGGSIAVRTSTQSGWPAWALGAALGLIAVIFHLVWPHPFWFLALRLLTIAGSAYAAGRLWAFHAEASTGSEA